MNLRMLPALGALVIGIASGGAAYAASTTSQVAACWKQGTTISIANCFAASGKEANDKLNRLYGQIMTVLGPGDQQRLQNAQRLWVSYRDATCNAEKNLWDGGTGGNPAYLACTDDETRHRLDYLQETYRLRLQKLR
jgi:uncharacterized protein YecT (DUF1311 family)